MLGDILGMIVVILTSNILIKVWRLIPREDRNSYQNWIIDFIDNIAEKIK